MSPSYRCLLAPSNQEKYHHQHQIHAACNRNMTCGWQLYSDMSCASNTPQWTRTMNDSGRLSIVRNLVISDKYVWPKGRESRVKDNAHGRPNETRIHSNHSCHDQQKTPPTMTNEYKNTFAESNKRPAVIFISLLVITDDNAIEEITT